MRREYKSDLLQEYVCKTEINDFDMPDPLENPIDSIDMKEVHIDFGVPLKNDFADIQPKLDIKLVANSLTGQLDYTPFDNAIQYQFSETFLEQVKEEIFDENNHIVIKENRKRKYLNTTSESSGQPKQGFKKTANKAEPSTSKNVKTKGCAKTSVKKNKPKKQKKGEKKKHRGEYSEPYYDGCVNSGQQIQQPDIPKYPAKCDHVCITLAIAYRYHTLSPTRPHHYHNKYYHHTAKFP